MHSRQGERGLADKRIQILANPSDRVEADEQSGMTLVAILTFFGLASLGGAIGVHHAIKKDDEARAAQGF